MVETHLDLLQKAWTEAAPGYLSAWEQAKAWALREVWRDEHDSDHGLGSYVAGKVKKAGGGHPTGDSIMRFYKKIDEDEEWFPGKVSHARKGPARVMTGAKVAALARSAMAIKSAGHEPTYPRVLAACPQAALNPTTNKPFSKKRVYEVFRENCYDEDPEKTWEHKARHAKSALTDDQMAKRCKFGHAVQERGHTAQWYFDHVVWTDLCKSILPATEAAADQQALARKGSKGWVSSGSERASYNLRGKQEVLKQKSWNTRKVWWAPILTRGKLHVVVFDGTFPGEEPAGATVLVQKLLVAVNVRFPNADRKPKWVMVDRGRGFYNSGNGKITEPFKKALRDCGFKAFWGDDASVQPGHLQEIMLHETAVSWLRRRLETTLPARCWEETPAAFGARLRQCCAEINAELNVDGLCRDLPRRIQQLVDLEGDRLAE